jgi:hypothetical protein
MLLYSSLLIKSTLRFVSKLTKSQYYIRKYVGILAIQPKREFQFQNNYISRPQFEIPIENAIKDNLCGVHILWSPPKIGKTLTVIHISEKLRKSGDIGGILNVTGDSVAVNYQECLFYWLTSRLGVPTNHFGYLSEIVPLNMNKPLLLIIDQFDYLMAHPFCEEFLTSLAEDSLKTKLYTVLVVITSEVHYDNILSWNRGQKIRTCISKSNISQLKWTRYEFESLLKNMVVEKK